MACNSGPDIIEDGLVLCLDAANINSYPKSGATWSDLSGNGNHGALQNMENNFDAGNKGSLTFDGGNERVVFSEKNDYKFVSNDEITVSAWIRPSNVTMATFQSFFCIGGNGSTLRDRNFDFRITNNIGNGRIDALYRNDVNNQWHIRETTASYAENYKWMMVTTTYTFASGGSWKIYINGNLVPSYYQQGNGNSAPIASNPSDVHVGVGEDGGGEFFNGRISNVLLYRRYLSADEVRRNYEATVGRYI
jgi:hypothetical protein